MIRRLLFPPGLFLLYVLLGLARVAYWPVQVVSPSAAKRMTGRVEWWQQAFSHWCLLPRP